MEKYLDRGMGHNRINSIDIQNISVYNTEKAQKKRK